MEGDGERPAPGPPGRTDHRLARVEPLRRCHRATVVAGRIGRGPVATETPGRGAMWGSADPHVVYRETHGPRLEMSLWRLRQPVARRLRTPSSRLAADPGGRHGVPLGDGRRARARLAGAIRLSFATPARVCHVCLVRTGLRSARGGAFLRETGVHALFRPSRRDPGPRRPTQRADRHGTGGAPIPPPRGVRGGPRSRGCRPVVVPAAADPSSSGHADDQRRSGRGGTAPSVTQGLDTYASYPPGLSCANSASDEWPRTIGRLRGPVL